MDYIPKVLDDVLQAIKVNTGCPGTYTLSYGETPRYICRATGLDCPYEGDPDHDRDNCPALETSDLLGDMRREDT